jgi:hypothetical protein
VVVVAVDEETVQDQLVQPAVEDSILAFLVYQEPVVIPVVVLVVVILAAAVAELDKITQHRLITIPVV